MHPPFSPAREKTRFYGIWRGIMYRCHNPKSQALSMYTSRGIGICKRWMNYSIFKKDMLSSYKEHVKKYGIKNTTIDRINGSKGYSPSNCRWATCSQQARNRRNTRFVKINGETRCLKEWSEFYKIPYQRVSSRIKMGWSVIDALTRPRGKYPLSPKSHSQKK